MNAIFKIMVYSMLLNIAVGIMTNAILDADGNPIFNQDPTRRGGLTYDSTNTDAFTSGMQTGVDPSGVLEDKGNAIYRVLDMLNLGFIQRFLETVTDYTHGFVKLLDNVFGRFLPQGLYNFLFGAGGAQGLGIFYVLVTIGYIYGAWALWTGKAIND